MRVVSGIQPTGDLHLGNLLGAILRWVKMQDEAECLFFLADLHALTVDVEPDKLAASVREMAAALIASGIDPAKSIVFRQSAVPAHPELAWILQGTARMGWLNRMTQWKDKAGKNKEGSSVGLFTYPVLQAADILLYKATHVPVGEDQKQHIELTRDIDVRVELVHEVCGDGVADDLALEQLARSLGPLIGVEDLALDPDRDGREQGADRGGDQRQVAQGTAHAGHDHRPCGRSRP